MTYISGCRLRALAPDLPIILITGDVVADGRELDLARGGPPVAVLAKPFTLDVLVRTLATVTGQSLDAIGRLIPSSNHHRRSAVALEREVCMTEIPLAMAERLVRDCEGLVARQEDLLAQLPQDNSDREAAMRLLEGLETTLDLARGNLRREAIRTPE